VDSEEYTAARGLGRALAEHGFVVVNGGFEGVMAAVSQGAREGGGRAIGVTVELLAQTRSANPWIDQEVRTAALLERIDKLIELGDGYAVLPGGAGTLLELGAVWNLSLLGAMHGKPIVVVGLGWQRVLEAMVEHLHALPADLEYLTLAPDAQSAARILSVRLLRWQAEPSG
jgi:uncharacterized protein (TIGR00730 family)